MTYHSHKEVPVNTYIILVIIRRNALFIMIRPYILYITGCTPMPHHQTIGEYVPLHLQGQVSSGFLRTLDPALTGDPTTQASEMGQCQERRLRPYIKYDTTDKDTPSHLSTPPRRSSPGRSHQDYPVPAETHHPACCPTKKGGDLQCKVRPTMIMIIPLP